MPVIYMIQKQSSLQKEPYASFDKKYKSVTDELYGAEIELPISTAKKGEFANGFYNCDYAFQRNVMLKFCFAKVAPEQLDGCNEEGTFIRATYSFEYDESDMLDFHLNRLKSFSLRGDYYYIPNVEYVEYSYSIAKEIHINIDAIVLNIEDVQQVCHSIINQFIAIFSLDD